MTCPFPHYAEDCLCHIVLQESNDLSPGTDCIGAENCGAGGGNLLQCRSKQNPNQNPANHPSHLPADTAKNLPFDFQLNTVIEDDTEPKVPLTAEQEESLLSFMQGDSVYQKYRDEVIILLGTGLRISELCGLTETDLDFENRIINVDHQLLRSAETGYYIEKPKTQSGIRQIPMSEKVYEALGRVLENRKGTKQITVDGYSNFLFLNRDGCPKTGVNYSNMFRGLVKKYNKSHEEALPKAMIPHTLRHTFCTNLANAGMNP